MLKFIFCRNFEDFVPFSFSIQCCPLRILRFSESCSFAENLVFSLEVLGTLSLPTALTFQSSEFAVGCCNPSCWAPVRLWPFENMSAFDSKKHFLFFVLLVPKTPSRSMLELWGASLLFVFRKFLFIFITNDGN